MQQQFLKKSTNKVSELLQNSLNELTQQKKGLLIPEIIFHTLIESEEDLFIKLCEQLKIDYELTKECLSVKLSESIEKLPDFHFSSDKKVSVKISNEINILFEEANRIRLLLEDKFISIYSLLTAFSSSKVKSTYRICEDIGLIESKMIAALKVIRNRKKISTKDAESRESALDRFTVDLTQQARNGLFDPVIGRDEEISRCIEILSRRKKSNPILLGEPGVGKTVVVEGIAQKIVLSDVPSFLLDKRILSLEISSLLAGAKLQGEFEERLKAVQDEIRDLAGEVILFIDEIHTMVGAGGSGQSLDASNMLKPALARGQLQCIGATTFREFKENIERDKALVRRFQIVQVSEPSEDQAIKILLGLKSKYEKFHGIQYSNESIESAVNLANKYIQDRKLPDKAIDLIDQAGAVVRISNNSTPVAMKDFEDEISKLEQLKREAFESSDYERSALLQMQISEISSQKQIHMDSENSENGAQNTVTRDTITEVISRLTGISLQKIASKNIENLSTLEERLNAHIIGQPVAIKGISQAIKRNCSGVRQTNKPMGSFLFLGPTGVGKTELTKAIALELYGSVNQIIRFDMSEFMEKHSISKLIGSPPGYVGYREGGLLTERVKRNPYSLVLFDEFEKAHPDVYHVLLPLLDEGYVSDSEGQKVDFQNTIVIGTANIGAGHFFDKKRKPGIFREDDATSLQESVIGDLNQFVSPEFINRLDQVIIFNKLDKHDLKAILKIQIQDLSKRLLNLGISSNVDPSIYSILLGDAMVEGYGARPIRRRIEILIENPISDLLISTSLKAGNQLKITSQDDQIVFDIT